jgi:hypothetical protein
MVRKLIRILNKNTNKMSACYQYNHIVIGENYVEGMLETSPRNRLFNIRDTPRKWAMTLFSRGRRSIFWHIGYVSDKQNELVVSPAGPGSYGITFTTRHDHEPYWWCRNRRWMPYWGEATNQRAILMKELRTFWQNKWFNETIPAIKKALMETTRLFEDVVELLPEYFEYPYEIKSY